MARHPSAAIPQALQILEQMAFCSVRDSVNWPLRRDGGVLCPEGAAAFSPGLARRAYPGECVPNDPINPERVAAVSRFGGIASAATPLGLMPDDGGPASQGSRYAATLGWRPQPRCGSIAAGSACPACVYGEAAIAELNRKRDRIASNANRVLAASLCTIYAAHCASRREAWPR